MNLNIYFQRLGITEELINFLIPLFSHYQYESGGLIQNISHNSGKICLIRQGIVRGFYIDEDGNDITKCFSKEGDWCCFYNYLSDDPPAFYVESLTYSLLAEISVSNFRMAIEKYPELRKIFDDLYRDAFLKAEQKGSAFQRLSAKDRYLQFIKTNPEITANVKQEYIASYLGVTPSSLSRIKKEL